MNKVVDILTKLGGIISNSHFVGTNGVHFDTYMNKDVLYPHIKETSRVCELFAKKYQDKNIEVVVGPAMGGIILSQWVAYHLNKLGNSTLAVFTEKIQFPDSSESEQIFSRGYDKLVKGKRVLIVEDNISTGGSVRKMIKAVQSIGGDIIGVCAMVNRNPQGVNSGTLGVPFESLSDIEVKLYKPEECPLCRGGVPVNTILGHGKKFLESRK
jgi:orotate phosphoribosyltransferase